MEAIQSVRNVFHDLDVIAYVATIQDVAAVVGPVAAAAAALGSLLAVRQTRKLAQDSVLPDLSAELTIDPNSLQIGGTIHNAGTGAGRNVYVILVHGGSQGTAYLDRGVIRANELFSLVTAMRGTTELVASKAPADTALAVFCKDREGRLHAWTHDGRHRDWRGAKVEDGMLADRFHELFPTIDLGTHTAVPLTLQGLP